MSDRMARERRLENALRLLLWLNDRPEGLGVPSKAYRLMVDYARDALKPESGGT